jgi:pimeloyl-ACP methyl ester carboxylesterase
LSDAPASHTAEVGGIRLHYLRAGEGPAVVLLHGWPQTSHMWRGVMPALAERHTLIAPDLRGYGRSDAPPSGYDKRTTAGDVRALVRELGLGRVAVVGHDRGARVAHRWALDHPEEVERVAMLDVIPTREVIRRFDATLAAGFWHWLFHMQPDLPEALVSGREAAYLEWFFERWAWRRAAIDRESVEEYVRAFSRPGRLRAGFEDYRATLTDDLPADNESFAAGRRLEMPLLALWGAQGLVGALPVAEIWREYAADVRAEAVPECGHFVPEEQPAAVVEHLRAFLGEAR